MNKPEKFTKLPVTIEAMQFKGSASELHDVYQWIEGSIGSVDPYGETPGVTIDPSDGRMVIRTLEGDMKVDLWDWVIRGVRGEFYPCKPDIFEKTYKRHVEA